MWQAAGLRREVVSEKQRDILEQRHEAVASGQRRRLQSVDRFELTIAGAEPQSEIVAALVGERLQEEGAQRRTVAMTASGSELPSLVTVMV